MREASARAHDNCHGGECSDIRNNGKHAAEYGKHKRCIDSKAPRHDLCPAFEDNIAALWLLRYDAVRRAVWEAMRFAEGRQRTISPQELF